MPLFFYLGNLKASFCKCFNDFENNQLSKITGFFAYPGHSIILPTLLSNRGNF